MHFNRLSTTVLLFQDPVQETALHLISTSHPSPLECDSSPGVWGDHRRAPLSSRNVFLTVPEAGSLRSGPVWWDESLFPGHRLLVRVLPQEGARELSAWSFPRAGIPLMGAPRSSPNHFSRAPPPTPSRWGVGGEWVLGFRPLSQGGGCQFPSLPGLCL